MSTNKYTAISYYKFTRIKNIFKYKNIFNKILKGFDIKGIILLAPEGINISISIQSSQLNEFFSQLKYFLKIDKKQFKLSYSQKHIFRKMKIKIKKEILTTRKTNNINPKKNVGTYIKPEDWDNFINKPDILLIDTRNYYEASVGTFKNSLNPNSGSFSDILKWLEKNILLNKNKNKKIAMFCTGGIRCEKATSFIKNKGYKEVYHLEGGILKYLETVKNQSNWVGECFVFDDRVSVNKYLDQGSYILCFACRMPLSSKDISSKNYIKGIACPYCYGKKTNKQIEKYKMRDLQFKKYKETYENQ